MFWGANSKGMLRNVPPQWCPGPPNLSVQRSDHNILIRWPLLYPSIGNSQELVFGGHDACQPAATTDSSSQGLAGLR
jgi:hypothetical protein